MELVYEASYNVIVSILIAKYYAAFLIPKRGKKLLTLIAFGVVYLLSRYLVGFLFSEFAVDMPFTLVKTVVIAGITFGLSRVFFQNIFGIQVFLLCSFFAVQDICVFLTTSLGNYISEMGRWIFNILWDSGKITTTEQTTTFFNTTIYINAVLHVLIFAAASILTLRYITKSFTHKNYTLRLSELLALTLPCLSGLSITHILRAILFNPDGSGLLIYNETPMINILILMAAFFLLLTLVASVRLFQKMIRLHMEEKNTAILRQQIRQMQAQDVDSIYSEIKGLRHDMKNHLSNIQFLVKEVIDGRADAAGELDGYLGKMDDAMRKIDFVYQTGNSITDVVIHQKYFEATNKGINFTADFIYPARLNLDAYDLAVILSNALENAIEACLTVPEPSRFIFMRSYIKGEMFFIEVENNFTGVISVDEQTGLLISNKQDKTAHGIGLSNIQHCAKKYYGDIVFQTTNKNEHSVFRLTVMLEGRN